MTRHLLKCAICGAKSSRTVVQAVSIRTVRYFISLETYFPVSRLQVLMEEEVRKEEESIRVRGRESQPHH
jgi:hypothetical protein